MAQERGLLDPMQLAVDSVRIRAHASTKSARTLKRSKQRLEELAQVERAALPPDVKAALEEKKAKHEAAVAECQRRGRSNVVTVAAHPR